MTIPVIWKSYHEEIKGKTFWDLAMLEKVFTNNIWKPVGHYEFISYEDFSEESEEGAVVVIPARYHYEDVEKINTDIKDMQWVLLIIAGDEESKFPVDELKHPNMMIYLMTPHAGKRYEKVDRFIGEGFPQYLFQNRPDTNKTMDWFFSGQVTHRRRKECVQMLEDLQGSVQGELIKTPGFTQGLSRREYYDKMGAAKIVPCPSGPETPDTFRLYEALELGCIPIADAISTKNENEGYWSLIFGDNIPFPIMRDWSEAAGHIENLKDLYPKANNRVFAWWQKYKRQLSYNIKEDIDKLTRLNYGFEKPIDESITVLIPTSPVPSNPSLDIIKHTISAVRAKLPTSEIIIMIDGVRPEQPEREPNYQEYIRRLLEYCNSNLNILPLIFEEHTHQAGMTKEALKCVKTETILFVEHDAPITPDCDFEWPQMLDLIRDKQANVIRFHFESIIPKEHKHMMLGKVVSAYGIKLQRTAQWSQRPHLASTEFYKEMLDKYFSENSKTMIEDRMHGIVHEAYVRRYKSGWNDFKLWIYHPDGSIKRSYHLDGREHDSKFEEKFIF